MCFVPPQDEGDSRANLKKLSKCHRNLCWSPFRVLIEHCSSSITWYMFSSSRYPTFSEHFLRTFVFSFHSVGLLLEQRNARGKVSFCACAYLRVAYSIFHNSHLEFTWHWWTGRIYARLACSRPSFPCKCLSFIWNMFLFQSIMFNAALNLVWYTDYLFSLD